MNNIRTQKNQLLRERQITQIERTTSRSKITKITRIMKNWLLKWLLDSSKGTNPDSRGVVFLGEVEKNENNKGKHKNTKARTRLKIKNKTKSNKGEQVSLA
jgi:hypothetical protein